MSKASDWVSDVRATEHAYDMSKRGQPKTQAWTPECLSWEAEVDWGGRLEMGFQNGDSDPMRECKWRITMSADHALILARFILDTFGEDGR